MTIRLAGSHTAGDICRGLAAAVVLVASIVGVPIGLLTIGADPRRLIPTEWPNPAEVRQWPEQAWRALRWAYYDGSLLPTTLLLVVWAAWLILVWMVLAETITQIHNGLAAQHRLTPASPRGWICGLVTAVLMLLSTSPTTTAPIPAAQSVATAHHDPPQPPNIVNVGPTSILRSGPVDVRAVAASAVTEVVRPPANGIYDSLWRIAERRLGDGARWPEIWELNRGALQVDGRVFTNPDLIHPGWVLHLPTSPQPAPADRHGDDTDTPAPQPPSLPPPETSLDPQAPTPATPSVTPAQEQPHSGTGITLGTGAFIGIGLAALITSAMITVRLWQRRHYRPGSGDRDHITTTPVVRALRIGYDHATLPHDEDGVLIQPNPSGIAPATRDMLARRRAQATARAALPAGTDTVIGVLDGQAHALHLARIRGLGLIGPGATAAARALLVSLLADQQRDPSNQIEVLIPAADIHALIDDPALPERPARLHIVDNLDAALDFAESELLTRTRHHQEADHPQPAPGMLVLVATPTPRSQRRLQAILDNGSTLGLAGVLLGPWPPGTTALVQSDGTTAPTPLDPSGTLTGTRLFTLPATDTRALLDLLSAADHDARERRSQPALGTQDKVDSPRLQELDRDSAGNDQPDEGDEFDSISRVPMSGTDQRHAETADDPTNEVCRSPDASTTVEATLEPVNSVLHLNVLGRLHLRRIEPDRPEDDIINAFAPRQREILTYLALHPNGVRKETLTADIWPDAPPDRPFNTFHATLSQLRGALGKATGDAIGNIVINDDGHYGLDRSLVTVDLWQLQHALTARRQAPNLPERVAALRQVATLYRGDLAEGLVADWIEPPREALRRDVLDALSALIRAVGDGDPEQMLTLLEQARGLDPYNEAIYRDLMRVQARLGQYDSIPRTLRLLTTSLAELDQRPTRDTLGLAELLRRPRPAQRRDREAS